MIRVRLYGSSLAVVECASAVCMYVICRGPETIRRKTRNTSFERSMGPYTASSAGIQEIRITYKEGGGAATASTSAHAPPMIGGIKLTSQSVSVGRRGRAELDDVDHRAVLLVPSRFQAPEEQVRSGRPQIGEPPVVCRLDLARGPGSDGSLVMEVCVFNE